MYFQHFLPQWRDLKHRLFVMNETEEHPQMQHLQLERNIPIVHQDK